MTKGTSVLYSRSCLQEEATETVVAKFSVILSYQDQRRLDWEEQAEKMVMQSQTEFCVGK